MMEQDTVKLLRECDAGIKMGVASIDDVLEHVQAKNFRDRLSVCRSEHKKLEDEVQSLPCGNTTTTEKSPIPLQRVCLG